VARSGRRASGFRSEASSETSRAALGQLTLPIMHSPVLQVPGVCWPKTAYLVLKLAMARLSCRMKSKPIPKRNAAEDQSVPRRICLGTRPSAMGAANTPATRTGTGSARSTSTRWKDFGRCCAPGCVRTTASCRISCRFTSASFSSFTTRGAAAKPCSARSSRAWLRDKPSTTPEVPVE